eukprot:6843919-Alexandrium_andersonii.AAC.1
MCIRDSSSTSTVPHFLRSECSAATDPPPENGSWESTNMFFNGAARTPIGKPSWRIGGGARSLHCAAR